MTLKNSTVETPASSDANKIHAETLCDCGGLHGCKPKTWEDIWFAERDHDAIAKLKEKDAKKKAS